jgi:hypothetical protein
VSRSGGPRSYGKASFFLSSAESSVWTPISGYKVKDSITREWGTAVEDASYPATSPLFRAFAFGITCQLGPPTDPS